MKNAEKMLTDLCRADVKFIPAVKAVRDSTGLGLGEVALIACRLNRFWDGIPDNWFTHAASQPTRGRGGVRSPNPGQDAEEKP